MPETHLPGNPFITAPAAPPVARPKHKPGNPFAPATAELDTFPSLTDEQPAESSILKNERPGGSFDPLWLQRQMQYGAEHIVPEALKGAGEGLATMASRVGAGIVRIGSRLSPVTALDPLDPQREDALPAAMDVRRKAGEDAAGNIRKVGKSVVAKIPFAPNPTTGQKVARVAGDITGQLAPFVAAGPLGLATGSGLNVAAEVGATPEESLLGMFSKEQAKSPLKRGAAALAGDVAIAAPLHFGVQALKNYIHGKTAVSPEELARIGDAIPGSAPPPEAPALPPSAPPAAVSRVGAIGNQPPVLPTKAGKRGPVVDLGAYPLGESPGGKARARPTERYQRTTKGGRGGIVDRSWMDEVGLKDESQLTDKVVSGQQRRVLDLAHEVADASPSGGIVVDPGAKTPGSIRNKIARKELSAERPDLPALSQIGDINRASIVVQHPNDAGPVIAKLQDSGWLRELDDKFAKPDELGYGAIHAQLVDPVTGQASELQIHTPQTWAARQTLGGHDIYDYLFSKDAKPLVTPADHAEARRLIEYNRKIYAEAHEAAMTGKPLPGQDSPYKLAMDIDPASPAYGRWSVQEKASGNIVAEADNPFKARTLLNELDKMPAEAPVGAPSAESQAAQLPDVPHGNYPQSNVDNPALSPGGTVPEAPPVNPFREQHAPVESKLQGPAGHEDVTYFGSRAVRTRYRVVDAGSLIASNDPHTFARRADYPAAIQGRVYHGSAGKGAAEQVVSGAAALDAAKVVNPNRNIVGPPVVSPEGPAIAGNQRVMMMQRVYDLHPERAAELKAQIVKDAGKVGIDPAAVEGMERPVLVREVTDPTVNVRDENTLRELNEISDRATGKAKDPLTEAMGRARQLKANSGALDHYAATSSAEEPLADYLQGPNGLPFLNKLVEDKVISPAELDSFRDASTGKITKQGRQKLQDMMSAAAVGDAGIIDAAPAAIVGKLEHGTPRLIQAAQTEGWSLEQPLQEALELHTSKTANGQKSIADALAQPDLLGKAEPSSQGKVLARFLEKEPKAKVSDAMRQWAEASEKARVSDGSADMFGVSAETPEEAFDRIFGGARRPEPAMVGGDRRGSIAGPVENDPYNYAAMKMLSSIAGTGAGSVAGATAGGKIPASTPEERKRNRLVGAGVGAMAGALTPFSPEMAERVLELAAKLRTAGAEAPAKLFQLHASPEIVRLKVAGQPSKEQMRQLFTAIQKNPKATFRWSMRDLQGNEVGSGRNLTQLAAEMPWADANRPVRTPEVGQVGAIGAQPDMFGAPAAPVQGSLLDEGAGAAAAPKGRSFAARQATAKEGYDFLLKQLKRMPEGPARKRVAAEVAELGKIANYGEAISKDEIRARNIAGDLFDRAGAVGNQPRQYEAAIKLPDGRIFKGTAHIEARLDAAEAGVPWAQLYDENIDGFVDKAGDFHTRDALSAGYGVKRLRSEDLNRAGEVVGLRNRTGAVGNQPEPRPGPRPPTRKVRSQYAEPDYVYWPRNSRESIAKAKTTLNLSTAGLDKTATARLRTLIASGLDKGTIDKGYRSFEEMDLSTLQRKRELLKELVEDPNTLVGGDKLQQIPTDDIKAMWMIAHDNTKTIEAAARVMNNSLATPAEIAQAAELHDKAYKQTEELLSRIVTGTAQKGRELGALRNIAKQSTDPEVWLVQAKKMLGDRPLSDAVQTEIRRLARRAQEACLGG